MSPAAHGEELPGRAKAIEKVGDRFSEKVSAQGRRSDEDANQGDRDRYWENYKFAKIDGRLSGEVPWTTQHGRQARQSRQISRISTISTNSATELAEDVKTATSTPLPATAAATWNGDSEGLRSERQHGTATWDGD
ncbi:hypothetical protein HDU90_005659 [Geranomyces variabilis]|nr:hypothetical protein HDU90_005659 [Geranomyces variabilis]